MKIIKNTKLLVSFVFLISSYSIAQTTEQFSLTNGDGWYRIIEKDWQGSGKIRISGISGSNKATNLTMFVSLSYNLYVFSSSSYVFGHEQSYLIGN